MQEGVRGHGVPEPQQEHQLQEEAHEDGADNDKAKGDRQTDKFQKLSIRMKYMRMKGECIMHGGVEWLFKRATTVHHIEHNSYKEDEP